MRCRLIHSGHLFLIFFAIISKNLHVYNVRRMKSTTSCEQLFLHTKKTRLYCRIQLEGLLYDVVRDLLAIA